MNWNDGSYKAKQKELGKYKEQLYVERLNDLTKAFGEVSMTQWNGKLWDRWNVSGIVF
jgi:hypothetical protein